MSNAPLSVALKSGIDATRKGHRLLARLHLADAVQQEPGNDAPWLWMAWVAESPAAAVSHLSKALEHNPDNEIARAGLIWARVMAEWDFERPFSPRRSLEAVAERETVSPNVQVTSTVLTPSIDQLLTEKAARPEDSMIFKKDDQLADELESEFEAAEDLAEDIPVAAAEAEVQQQSVAEIEVPAEPVAVPEAVADEWVEPEPAESVDSAGSIEITMRPPSQNVQIVSTSESQLDQSIISGDLVPPGLSDSLFKELSDFESIHEQAAAIKGSTRSAEPKEAEVSEATPEPVAEVQPEAPSVVEASAPPAAQVEATPEPVVAEAGEAPSIPDIELTEEPTPSTPSAPKVEATVERAESIPIDAITGTFVGKAGATKLGEFTGFHIESAEFAEADPNISLSASMLGRPQKQENKKVDVPPKSEPNLEMPAQPAKAAEPSFSEAEIDISAVVKEAGSAPFSEAEIDVGVNDSGFDLASDLAADAESKDSSVGPTPSDGEINSRDFVELTQSAVDIEMASKNDLNLGSEDRPQRILIVDDSPTVCKIVSITLKKRGYKVSSAGDGVEAMTMISADRPDLILLDINMPRMDGYQLCKLIKGYPETKDIPVVMLSGKDGFFDRVRGKLVGCSDYVTKPFDPEQLVATVEQYLPRTVSVAK